MITIPVTLEQLISTVQKLPPDERSAIAKALIQTELQSDLTNLIEELYSQSPIDTITDDDILHEIKAVRSISR
jgi:hypothetical protein